MRKSTAARFLAGVGFGAGVALLFAPRSGAKTRLLLAKRTRKGADYLKHQATALWDSATDLIEKGQEEVAHRKQGLRRAIEIGKRTYLRSVG